MQTFTVLAFICSFIIAVYSLDGVTPTQGPVPDPQEGNYVVNDTTGVPCIRMNVAIQVEFQYSTTQNETRKVSYNLPANSTASGDCGTGGDIQYIDLNWADRDWTSRFNFTKADKKFTLNAASLTFLPSTEYFPDINSQPVQEVTAKAENLTEIKAQVGKSYVCNTVDAITMTENVTLHIHELQVQAFMDTKKGNGEFGPEQECPSDNKPNNIVPIAVGAALAGLVLIVLIAYIIGRNRNKRGYESV